MLKALSIRNIVLIEQCEIALGRGLCVLTGETGAGKSILLDALGLALGMRAESRLVRHGKDQATVVATFDISANAPARAALDALGIEPADELLLRRTLARDGKTKCFANDVAVGVAALKQLGESLLEIHGQHDGRGLLDPATHRILLDAYGELEDEADEVAETYASWKQAQAALTEADQQIVAALREKEYLLHMQKELSALAAGADEETTLADTRTRMMQSEKLAETLADTQRELETGKGTQGALSAAQRILTRSTLNANGQFTPAIEALERASAELGEAESQIAKLLTEAHYDPARLEQIEERLFAIRAMARKYDVPTAHLPQLLNGVNQKLGQLQNQQTQIASLTKAVETCKAAYQKTAETLSASRAKAARQLEKAVRGELASLKMATTQFRVMQKALPEDRWGANGSDAVQFQAATNTGAALAPLHKIASGGELSRFMLAMKVALAKVKSTPSLIFDEIDSGTGGAVADAIGQRLARLGKTHQVLVVTHLPQVAACGDMHLMVQKEEKRGATFTSVETLSAGARKEELARMLAGAEVTAEARKAAAKLLQAAG